MNSFLKFIIAAFIVLLLVNTNRAQAQNYNDYRLGIQYIRDNKFEQAVEIFEKLYYSNRSQTYFTYYIQCLKELEEYRKAEKVIKEQIKSNKTDLSYRVELGELYKLQRNNEKSADVFNEAIDDISPDQHQVIRLANAFMANREFDYALKAYQKGRKLLSGTYGFNIELAQLYYYQRNYGQMVEEYLDLLAISGDYLQQVSSALQNALNNDIDNNLPGLLKESLLERLKLNPDNQAYAELLIWVLVQQKDFELALMQVKALDLRNNESGERAMALARMAIEGNDYSTAGDAYQFVIDKGNMFPFYTTARNEMLNVIFTRIKLGLDSNPEQYRKAEQLFKLALAELGRNNQTVEIIKNHAHIQAFYLAKADSAIILLEQSLEVSNLNPMQRGELNLKLGDIYLLAGKVWDATFAYARVEDQNKENPIGSEAKLAKARLAYFIGNFDWSRAQLDVLKASTSKLIANDAAELALFIFENSGWDSVETALELYSRADLYRYQENLSMAVITIDSLISVFPEHVLMDEAWYLKGNILKSQGKSAEAIASYQVIVDKYYDDVLADNALYMMAQIYEFATGEKEKAMECYQKILLDFKDSIFTQEARRRYRMLRGDKV